MDKRQIKTIYDLTLKINQLKEELKTLRIKKKELNEQIKVINEKLSKLRDEKINLKHLKNFRL